MRDKKANDYNYSVGKEKEEQLRRERELSGIQIKLSKLEQEK